MKLRQATVIIDFNHGYLVSFEKVDGRMLTSDHVPDVRAGEDPFLTVEDAIEFGERLATATVGCFVNFHIIRSDNFTPIGEWRRGNRVGWKKCRVGKKT